jgi:hypothetical protein
VVNITSYLCSGRSDLMYGCMRTFHFFFNVLGLCLQNVGPYFGTDQSYFPFHNINSVITVISSYHSWPDLECADYQ